MIFLLVEAINEEYVLSSDHNEIITIMPAVNLIQNDVDITSNALKRD